MTSWRTIPIFLVFVGLFFGMMHASAASIEKSNTIPAMRIGTLSLAQSQEAKSVFLKKYETIKAKMSTIQKNQSIPAASNVRKATPSPPSTYAFQQMQTAMNKQKSNFDKEFEKRKKEILEARERLLAKKTITKTVLPNVIKSPSVTSVSSVSPVTTVEFIDDDESDAPTTERFYGGLEDFQINQ